MSIKHFINKRGPNSLVSRFTVVLPIHLKYTLIKLLYGQKTLPNLLLNIDLAADRAVRRRVFSL